MKLTELLSKTDIFSLIQSPVLVLHGVHYSPIFCSFLLEQIRVQAGKSIIRWDVSTYSVSQLHMQLQTSFLGSSTLFWLSDFTDCDVRRQRELLTLLNTYTGPHSVCVFISSEQLSTLSASITRIEVPKCVDLPLFQAMSTIMQKRFALSPSVVRLILNEYKNVSLDAACLLLQYAAVIDHSLNSEAKKILNVVAKLESSLFLLSQYFFAKQTSAFFSLWHEMYADYSPLFWTTFWSEQLWQAYHYIKLSKQQQTRARAIATRLPFSFFKQDFKRYSLIELQRAHDFVYSIDCALKNGSTFPHFDLFFAKFFSHLFT